MAALGGALVIAREALTLDPQQDKRSRQAQADRFIDAMLTLKDAGLYDENFNNVCSMYAAVGGHSSKWPDAMADLTALLDQIELRIKAGG